MNATVLPTCEILLETFPELLIQIVGDPKAQVNSVSAPEQNVLGSTVFCATPKAIVQGLASTASILVIPRKSLPELETKRGAKTFVVSTNVERAMAAVINKWFLGSPYRDPSIDGIHPTAVVHETAQISQGVQIAPHAVIGKDVVLASGVYVGANAVIEANCRIGRNSTIHPLVYIGHGTQIGERCEVLSNSTIGKEGFGYAHDENGNHYRIPHQGHVVIEDDVHIGSGCSIDRGTFGESRIGYGTKLDNQIHLAHNSQIGRNCLLTAGFAMAGSSRIGDNFIAGGNTTVTGHIVVTNNVQVAGMSVISKSVDKPGQYGGFPLQPLQSYLKTRAALGHLPEFRKQVSLLIKKFMPEALDSTKPE